MKKLFRVIKYYHYAEIYDVEADTKEDAIELVDTGEYGENDDIYQEFDFYEAMEIKQ